MMVNSLKYRLLSLTVDSNETRKYLSCSHVAIKLDTPRIGVFAKKIVAPQKLRA